jgi:hypothetical protein
MNVAIYLCNRSDSLDYKKLIATCAANSKHNNYKQVFKMFLIDEYHQLKNPDKDDAGLVYTFDKHPPIDVLIVAGTDRSKTNLSPTLRGHLVHAITQAQLLVGIFAGAQVLNDAGCSADLLIIKKQQEMKIQQDRDLESAVRKHARWSANIRVVTRGNTPELIVRSLGLIDKLEHLQLVKISSRQIEFDW